MSPLVKSRSERDQMLPVQRRRADFVPESGQSLRDDFAQQRANAWGIAQPSGVRFNQKLGLQSYSDLNYLACEAIVYADNNDALHETSNFPCMAENR